MTSDQQASIAATIVQLQAQLAVQQPIAVWDQIVAARWNPSWLDLERCRTSTNTVQALNNTIATLQRQQLGY